jgi:hypothetical protein
MDIAEAAVTVRVSAGNEVAMNNHILEQGGGILRLAPTWVPRAFWTPGKRLKLHPDDLYAFGAQRGGIDERWLASTIMADNGPATTADEGLSYVVYEDNGKVQKRLFSELIAELGAALLGSTLWESYHRWPVFAKFFDNKGPLPHHLHQTPAQAALVGQQPKPESYFFPAQMNNYSGDFPATFFGLAPETTRDQVRHCLEIWDRGDNHITDLSKAYPLTLGTGWYVPPAVLHAPGSLCTYEPQWASDVGAMFQSVVNEIPIPWDLLVKSVPPDKHQDLDYIVSLIDFETNRDPNFKQRFFRPAIAVKPEAEMESEGYRECWISYRNPYFAAKELTVLPGRTVTIHDTAPYGLILVQGHGTLDDWPIETPTLIRFGQLTHDEYFVSAPAAQQGVHIVNASQTEPLVMLKHFGPHAEAEGI